MAQAQADTNSTAVVDMKAENILLRGIIQKQAKQITHLKERVNQLVVRSMENNIIINGILGNTKKEICKDKVITFFKEVLEIDVMDEEAFVAHRHGKLVKGKHVQCWLDATSTSRKGFSRTSKT